jgi:hypothetical protein
MHEPQFWVSTSHTEDRRCPVCHTMLDGVSAVTDAAQPDAPVLPQMGDLTVCLYCVSFLIFEPHGFRLATQAECGDVPAWLREYLVSQWRGRPT